MCLRADKGEGHSSESFNTCIIRVNLRDHEAPIISIYVYIFVLKHNFQIKVFILVLYKFTNNLLSVLEKSNV